MESNWTPTDWATIAGVAFTALTTLFGALIAVMLKLHSVGRDASNASQQIPKLQECVEEGRKENRDDFKAVWGKVSEHEGRIGTHDVFMQRVIDRCFNTPGPNGKQDLKDSD